MQKMRNVPAWRGVCSYGSGGAFILNFIRVLFLLSSLVLLAHASIARVYIVKKNGKAKRAYLSKVSKKAITYIDNPKDTSGSEVLKEEVQTIFFYQPKSFAKALALFNNYRFQDAYDLFTDCKMKYKPYDALDGNYSTIAGFYELECVRRLGDLARLDQLLNDFRPAPLLDENHLTQLAIYPFWHAVHTASWERLLTLAPQWENKKLPGTQRAQIAFCHALALEALGEREGALLKFHEALAVSDLKEQNLISKACAKIIFLITEQKEVLEYLKLPLDTRSQSSRLYHEVLAASSVAKLWSQLSHSGSSFPSEYQPLLKIPSPFSVSE